MARRKLDKHRSPAGKIPVHAWEQEQARLHQEYTAEYEQYKPMLAIFPLRLSAFCGQAHFVVLEKNFQIFSLNVWHIPRAIC